MSNTPPPRAVRYTTRYTVRLDVNDAALLVRVAEQRHVPRSQLLRLLVFEEAERLEKGSQSKTISEGKTNVNND